MLKTSITLGLKMLCIFVHAFSCKWSRFHCGPFGNNKFHTLHKTSITSPFCSSGFRYKIKKRETGGGGGGGGGVEEGEGEEVMKQL